MKLKFTSIIILLFLVLGACRSSIKVVEKSETKTNTLKEKVTSFRDTVLTVDAVKSELSLNINDLISSDTTAAFSKDTIKSDLNGVSKPFKPPVFKPKRFTQTNGRSKVTVTIDKDGKLNATSECDSIALRAQIKSELVREFKEQTEVVDNSRKVKTGYSLITLIFYCLASFSIGAVAAYLFKTIKSFKIF